MEIQQLSLARLTRVIQLQVLAHGALPERRRELSLLAGAVGQGVVAQDRRSPLGLFLVLANQQAAGAGAGAPVDIAAVVALAVFAQAEELTEIPIRPKTTNIHVSLIGLAWLPYRDVGDGRLQPAWDQ